MAFQVSPGVLVQERDLTRIIPAYQQVLCLRMRVQKRPLDDICYYL